MINTVRGEGEPVLLVDCGGSFSNRFSSAAGEMLADKSLQVANTTGYAAMNIGPGEFSFGIDFLRKKSSDISFPLVASNLSYAEGVSPFTKSFVITQAGGLKVAILGVMPQGILEAMPKSGTSGIVEVIPPDKALALILPVVRKEADIVILLSQLGATETKRLAGDLEGIDLFIYGGGDNQPAKCDEDVQASLSTVGSEALVLKASAKGAHLGYARLSVDDAGRVTVDMKKMIFIDQSVAMDDKVVAITGTEMYKSIAEERKRASEEQQRELEALQKLTPVEYMQKLLKEQKGERKQ